MNVHDKAHELAKALKESSEFKAMKEAMEKIEANPDAKSMMDDFKSSQMELQQRMMTGQQPNEEEVKKIESQFEVINMNEHIKAMFDAEKQFGAVMDDVNKIMSEALQDLSKS